MIIVRAGYAAPRTQHPVCNEYGILIGEVDLAWPELKTRIARMDAMTEAGRIVIRITARDGEATVRRRIARAWSLRA